MEPLLTNFKSIRRFEWRVVNLVFLAFLFPMVVIYLLAPVILIISEPAIANNFGVLPWLAILIFAYAVFLVFVCIGFIGTLYRRLDLFKSYLVTLISMLVITTIFFGQVLLLFENAFRGGAYTFEGVDFTCGSNATILILSIIDKATGDPVPANVLFPANTTLFGDLTGSQVSEQLCDQNRRVLIVTLLVLGIIMPLLCCGPCIYSGVRFFKELSTDKIEINIDLMRSPYGGNDPSAFDLIASKGDDDDEDDDHDPRHATINIQTSANNAD